MSVIETRPKAISVIGYATFALGVFVLCLALLAPLLNTEQPDHPYIDAALGCVIACLIISTGRALLRLRRWASFVIEGVAVVILLFLVVFGVGLGGIALQWLRGGMPTGTMLTVGGSLILLYGVPLTFTVVTLRRARLRGVLR